MFEACAYMYTYACIKYARMTKTFGKQTKENRITCNPATTITITSLYRKITIDILDSESTLLTLNKIYLTSSDIFQLRKQIKFSGCSNRKVLT